MKKLFVALSLVLGFSAAQALDGTLKIQSEVIHPQTKQMLTIDFGNYVFDVFRDRRELVREVYSICKNPPEKIKTFLANRKNLGDNSVYVYFNFLDLKYSSKPTYTSVVSCSYDYGKFYSINAKTVLEYGDKNARPLNDVVKEIIEEDDYYSEKFARFIDAARAEAKQKGVSFTTPNKTINIKFGSQTINPETGAEGVATYPSLDYKFNVYDDRRELIKKIWEACAIKLHSTKLKEIYKDNKEPTSVSVWYEHPNGGLAELETMKCEFNSRGTLRINDYRLDAYVMGKVSAENIDDKKLNEWINAVAFGDSGINDLRGRGFNREFIILIDAANASSKGSQKSGTKAKK